MFSSICSFIDDVCTFNNNKLETIYKDIYTDELQLKEKHEDPRNTLVVM